jgi:hypothetical protein
MSDTSAKGCDIIHLDDVETLDSVSSSRLVALARAGASGELVCACEQGESHLYLQRGRVAWANDCKHQRAFTSHLKEHAKVDPAAIEDVVADCRATKRPLGEALVERNLATEAQVRAALRHQIGLALHIGECCNDGTAVFLQRDYDVYDVRFTFDAAELVAEEGGGASPVMSRAMGAPAAEGEHAAQ